MGLSLVVDNTKGKQESPAPSLQLDKYFEDMAFSVQVLRDSLKDMGTTARKCPFEPGAFYLDPEELFDKRSTRNLNHFERGCVMFAVRGEDEMMVCTPNRLVVEVHAPSSDIDALAALSKMEIAAEMSRQLEFGSVTWVSTGYLSYQLTFPLIVKGLVTETMLIRAVEIMHGEINSLMQMTSRLGRAYKR